MIWWNILSLGQPDTFPSGARCILSCILDCLTKYMEKRWVLSSSDVGALAAPPLWIRRFDGGDS